MGNTSNTFASPVLARYIAWANIFVQTLFPLAAAFTPVMTARAQSASLVVVDAVSRPYTLGGGGNRTIRCG